MTARDATPAVRSAIIKGAIAEAVLLAVTLVLFFVFQQIWILIAAGLVSSAIMLFLIFQARTPNDR